MKRFIIMLLFTVLSPGYADILYLNSGEEINGKIESLTGNMVKVLINDRTQIYQRADVLKMQFVSEYRENGKNPFTDAVIKELMTNPPSPKDYPDDGFLTWFGDTNIEIDKNKNIKTTVRTVRYVLRERGKSGAALSQISYLPGIETVKINYAFSITGSTVTYLNDISVQEGSDYSSFPEYDFAKSIKFAVPNIQIGSIIDYKFERETLNLSTYPFFANIAFRFGEPVRKQRISVLVPKEFKLNYEEFNMPKNMVFSKKENADNSQYIWEVENTPSIKDELHMPPFYRYTPQVLLSIEDTWQNVQEVFAPMINAELDITPEMIKKASEITQNLNSDINRLESLYNWVVKEIKYVPVSIEDYSFIPKKTSEIFNSKVANSIDKPFLLYAMLKAAGFAPDFGYVRYRNKLFEKDLPNIRQFSAGQVMLDLNGKSYVLCPISDNYRFSEMPGYLQGSYSLKILSGGKQSDIFQNTIFAPEKELVIQTDAMKLNKKGELQGNFKILVQGTEQADWRGLKDRKKEDVDRFFEQYIHSMHPQAKLVEYKIENLPDLSKDLTITVSYVIEDYAMKAGEYMILRLPGVEHTSYDVGQTQREFPLFWYTRSKNARISEIEMPSGFKLYYVPPDMNIETGGHKYSANYKTDGQKLIFNEDYQRLETDLAAEDYFNYKRFKETISKFTENWIVLKK